MCVFVFSDHFWNEMKKRWKDFFFISFHNYLIKGECFRGRRENENEEEEDHRQGK